MTAIDANVGDSGMNKILIDRQLLERLDCLEEESEFVYEDGRHLGRFIPEHETPEHSREELPPGVSPPLVTDPAVRARILQELVDRMSSNPIPANAPRFTRDELHDRR